MDSVNIWCMATRVDTENGNRKQARPLYGVVDTGRLNIWGMEAITMTHDRTQSEIEEMETAQDLESDDWEREKMKLWFSVWLVSHYRLTGCMKIRSIGE